MEEGSTGIERIVLKDLVESGKTLREIAEATGSSQTSVRYWIRRYELPKPISVRRAEYQRAVREGRSSYRGTCARHGLTEFAIVGTERRGRCKRCRAEAVARRRRKVKAILVAEAGGCCQLCGYDECAAALEFHHIDPARKAFGIGMRGVTRAIATVRAEVAKCVLLCANCHAAVEFGERELPLKLGRAPRSEVVNRIT